MWNLLRQHERFLRDALAAGPAPDLLRALREHHAQMIRFMQHERLIHLIVMLLVALFLLLTAGFALVHPHLGAAALAVIFLGMTAAYLVHYFRLENGVQRWYAIARELDERITGETLGPPTGER
jgi:Ca2+/Na+ antiporter